MIQKPLHATSYTVIPFSILACSVVLALPGLAMAIDPMFSGDDMTFFTGSREISHMHFSLGLLILGPVIAAVIGFFIQKSGIAFVNIFQDEVEIFRPAFLGFIRRKTPVRIGFHDFSKIFTSDADIPGFLRDQGYVFLNFHHHSDTRLNFRVTIKKETADRIIPARR